MFFSTFLKTIILHRFPVSASLKKTEFCHYIVCFYLFYSYQYHNDFSTIFPKCFPGIFFEALNGSLCMSNLVNQTKFSLKLTAIPLP